MNTPGTSPAIGPFSKLSKTTTHMLLQRAMRCDLRRGELLMRQGHPSVHAFLIKSGNMLLLRTDDCGEEVALDLLGPGGVCGIEDALCGQPYELSARATTHTVCYSILTHAIREVVSSDVSVAKALARYVAARLRLAAEHMEILTLGSIEERVKRILQRLILNNGQRHGTCLLLPITQGDLASLVGGSRQSVNRSLAGLRLRGIVTSHARHISVSEDIVSLSRSGGAVPLSLDRLPEVHP